ncbi:putative iron-dependent peroxidase [Tessaracoccus bendigoensis DSM 12906]|uniref:Putative iron-dependent peroxidase n=2 Tax=Tessaracoccus TaxID=72763 RepID=A0A1M6IV97_9ACTN|nr:putative iron-dependent peroxidase [Tessaracoccus bendigoensis DSM 12906]
MFLVANIDRGGESTVYGTLASLAGLTKSVGFRYPERNLTLFTGIGSLAWDRLFAGPRPARLHPFRSLEGQRHTAPSTPGDLLFHIRADTPDLCFELATRILDALDGAVTVVDSVQGFRYFETRDLLGFVDGTENPTGEAAEAATTVGAEDSRFAGGSYVHIQKYLHDMPGWKALSVDEQERVIGRKKFDDIELADEDKPTNAHVVLNSVEDDDGNELDIVRLNMPFGDVGRGEFGTYFIAYSRDPAVTEQMLENMFIGDPPGNSDAILEFSTAITGGLFYVPPAAFLDDPLPLSHLTPAPTSPVGTAPAAPSSSGSLNIGSLKGQN